MYKMYNLFNYMLNLYDFNIYTFIYLHMMIITVKSSRFKQNKKDLGWGRMCEQQLDLLFITRKLFLVSNLQYHK